MGGVIEISNYSAFPYTRMHRSFAFVFTYRSLYAPPGRNGTRQRMLT